MTIEVDARAARDALLMASKILDEMSALGLVVDRRPPEKDGGQYLVGPLVLPSIKEGASAAERVFKAVRQPIPRPALRQTHTFVEMDVSQAVYDEVAAKRKILVADLLCGAGGSSTGCARALAELGLEMELVCVNHWGVAIETHKKNHPEARHYCQDIATVRPHLIVPEGYLDLLMASPTCTHHSVARGGKPTSDQQRSDPWHIITWLTELRVKRMIIENVWEFIGWGPVDPRTGKPIKSRKGEYFQAWIDTIRRLGFEPEWRKLNAADYGDATTRQRFILMARNDGKRSIAGRCRRTSQAEDGKLELFPGT
jgi:hypothetical protein